MLSMKCFRVATLAVAAIGLGLVTDSAFAGDDDRHRSHDREYRQHDRGYDKHRDYDRHRDRDHRPSHDRWHSRKSYDHRPSHDRWHGKHRDSHGSRVKASYGNDNFRFSVSIGSDSHRQPRYHRDSYHQRHVVYTPPSRTTGYWKQVYHQPVYEMRYRTCGTPYRVCVRAGYYERVWVSTPYCR